MMSDNIYSMTELNIMNCSRTWNNCIKIHNPNVSAFSNYKLYATGDADVNGRKYVAININEFITLGLIDTLNLWVDQNEINSHNNNIKK
tara:strand:- start:2113 stop:2379 length:267 start_codon:yes stop_codon:yes gene_type:complete